MWVMWVMWVMHFESLPLDEKISLHGIKRGHNVAFYYFYIISIAFEKKMTHMTHKPLKPWRTNAFRVGHLPQFHDPHVTHT